MTKGKKHTSPEASAAFKAGIRMGKFIKQMSRDFWRSASTLARECFADLFPAFIAERSTRFSNPTRNENSLDGTRRTNVFFCDPMNSNQKSQIERNHEPVREILPEGVSFDASSCA